MTPGHLSWELERQQNQALKHIYGQGMSAAKMREKAGIQTLKSRREAATIKFAEKSLSNPRVAHWFPLRSCGRPTRSKGTTLLGAYLTH